MPQRFLQLGLSVAIAVGFCLTVILGIETFLPHADFNKERSNCWERYQPAPLSVPAPSSDTDTEEEMAKSREAQERQRACLDAIQREEESFVRKAFVIAMLAGSLGVAVGVLVLPKVIAAGASGITFGGIGAMLYAFIRGIAIGLDEKMMFVAALGAFVLLLFVAKKRTNALRSASSPTGADRVVP